MKMSVLIYEVSENDFVIQNTASEKTISLLQRLGESLLQDKTSDFSFSESGSPFIVLPERLNNQNRLFLPCFSSIIEKWLSNLSLTVSKRLLFHIPEHLMSLSPLIGKLIQSIKTKNDINIKFLRGALYESLVLEIKAIKKSLVKSSSLDIFLFFHVLKPWHMRTIAGCDDITIFTNINSSSLCPCIQTTKSKIPFKAVESASKDTQLIICEMKAFVKSFNINEELRDFWQRKTGMIVLCVLMTQKEGEEEKLVRGVNMEISLPTGALCAERNAIGTALSNDMGLKRSDFKAMAICSFSLDGKRADCNPMWPCGVCKEWLHKIAEKNPLFKIISFSSSDCEYFVEKIFD